MGNPDASAFPVDFVPAADVPDCTQMIDEILGIRKDHYPPGRRDESVILSLASQLGGVRRGPSNSKEGIGLGLQEGMIIPGPFQGEPSGNRDLLGLQCDGSGTDIYGHG